MKKWRALLAVLLFALVLTCAASADNTVTHTTDENGNQVTIVTDADGNQTIIQQTEASEDDITFDEDELDLEDEPFASEAPAAPAPVTEGESGASTTGWLVALAAAVAAVVVIMVFLRKRKH